MQVLNESLGGLAWDLRQPCASVNQGDICKEARESLESLGTRFWGKAAVNGEGDARGCLRGPAEQSGEWDSESGHVDSWGEAEAGAKSGGSREWEPGLGHVARAGHPSATQFTPMTSSNCLFSLHLVCSPFKQGWWQTSNGSSAGFNEDERREDEENNPWEKWWF